ncbi:serine/threonine protein kinase, putative [Entamoeba invadens IP1]|uniref:Serine/threonine protein kinase, putative n=1 Tax=Entamoeba invadens IP1 TaxID=370355 RepID=A0A0A1UBI4_ENTIV|nr:serine/threonine protein kinase, putative [Entamoeba invadens IP1]ELP91027.1 serine/threonine protein kinase, putative [Entamoeba invadens IP1]|eukprot:XP_004257798.1 serine/threonine protein kinase, putative [Entamoeba invadens IP1]
MSYYQTLNTQSYFEETGPPFSVDEDFGVTYRLVKTKTKQQKLLISLQLDPSDFTDIQNNLTALSSLFYTQKFKIMKSFMKVDRMVIGLVNTTVECWLIGEMPYTTTLEDHLISNSPRQDERKFLLHDLLHICDDLHKSQVQISFLKNHLFLRQCDSSPFPQLCISPVTLLIPYVSQLYGIEVPDFKEVVSKIIPTILNTPESHIFSEALLTQPIEQVFTSQFVSELERFSTVEEGDMSVYTPISPIGTGGFGLVFKAAQRDGRVVAIKESGPKGIDYLKREAVILTICHHPNIVSILGFGVSKFSLGYKLNFIKERIDFPRGYLVMECCNGDLNAYVEGYLKRGELLSLNLVSAIFKQIAECMHYLHFEKGLIHRDIKLENFLIVDHTPYPLVKITDFGFSRSLANEMETYKGSPLFIAPEIMLRTPYSSKSDLYSIGVCLFRLCTCQFPFGSTEAEFVRFMKEKKEVVFPRKLEENSTYASVIDLTKKLMKYDDEQRIDWDQFYGHYYMKFLFSSFNENEV